MTSVPSGFTGPERRNDEGVRELLARLDERTERIDRDIRQMINGQKERSEELERRIDGLQSMVKDDIKSLEAVLADTRTRTLAQEERSKPHDLNNLSKSVEAALSLAHKHDKWLDWALKIVMGAVLVALLATVGLNA